MFRVQRVGFRAWKAFDYKWLVFGDTGSMPGYPMFTETSKNVQTMGDWGPKLANLRAMPRRSCNETSRGHEALSESIAGFARWHLALGESVPTHRAAALNAQP